MAALIRVEAGKRNTSYAKTRQFIAFCTIAAQAAPKLLVQYNLKHLYTFPIFSLWQFSPLIRFRLLHGSDESRAF
jgi:hypothetical protein